MFSPLVPHELFRYPANVVQHVEQDRSIVGQGQFFELQQMFALDPHKHLENTNQREVVDIFITFGKSGRKHSNLCPEPIKQVGDSGIGNRKILTTSPERSHRLLCITPKLSQFFAQQIPKSLRIFMLHLFQIHFFLHDSSM
jgi:hypothetical protein